MLLFVKSSALEREQEGRGWLAVTMRGRCCLNERWMHLALACCTLIG